MIFTRSQDGRATGARLERWIQGKEADILRYSPVLVKIQIDNMKYRSICRSSD